MFHSTTVGIYKETWCKEYIIHRRLRIDLFHFPSLPMLFLMGFLRNGTAGVTNDITLHIGSFAEIADNHSYNNNWL